MYERTKRDRFPGSGRKFLANQRYVQWRNGRFHGNSCNVTPYSLKEHLERILFIQGDTPRRPQEYLDELTLVSQARVRKDVSFWHHYR